MNPYSLFIDIKNKIYDMGLIDQVRIENTPVISIGNLNAGGSGKTPFIKYCVELILRHKVDAKILVVTKSYKASLKSPESVDLTATEAVKKFGDEACLLKKMLPTVDVWSGPHKSETALQAAQIKKYDYIFIDDGFSHRKLFRNLDIVLFDVSRPRRYYKLFPFGFMRESYKALSRSQLVVLTKSQNADLSQLHFYKKQIQKYSTSILTLKNEIFISNPQSLKKIALFTGIANPDSLKKDLIDQGFEIVFEKIYPDHYGYPLESILEIKKMILKYSEALPVMTEKDLIKINDLELLAQVVPIQLKLVFNSNEEDILNEKILRSV